MSEIDEAVRKFVQEHEAAEHAKQPGSREVWASLTSMIQMDYEFLQALGKAVFAHMDKTLRQKLKNPEPIVNEKPEHLPTPEYDYGRDVDMNCGFFRGVARGEEE